MQLKKSKGLTIAHAIAQASAVLLGATAPLVSAHADDHGWQVDTAALFYTESDSRVQAAEPVISMKKDMGDEKILNLKLVLDSLTGASPNGAAPANVAQIFTGPSGGGTYTTPAGEIPLDDEFKDTRAAISAGWQQPIGENLRLNVGGNISSEFDFQSVGVNAAIAKDINDKNTTLSAGLNLEFDNIDPVGGSPEPFATMVDKVAKNLAGGADTKTVTDLLLGVTQVINRNAIVQVNYSLSMANGYQSDPYKMLTVLDGSNNLMLDPSIDNTSGYNLYLFEVRPDSRTKHSLYTQLKYHLTKDVIDASYRYTTDDWGVNSHTLDLKYRWELGHAMYLEPHVRWYTQTEADFYKPYLQAGSDVAIVGPTVTSNLDAASADPRLGSFDATTFGVKYGIGLSKDSELNFRIEKYDQKANGPAAPATGDLAGQQLQPDLSAMWLQIGYSFRW
ncbi:MAG: DUF3570 domain-containing protein [Moraxellaceae bacterium]|jgi:hypothetical protein|nr:DUF3570 domain-containing protein [Moraxellaceae bacterium]MBP7228977.1 DUF3570 domain-containing protein [Moraxellaceae bacterium]MBP8851605.1 DUF3570 domain-containing protein [Moraxellaceae bacterium]MBP9044856.1 DUF3570 domain-containing protein [Moraxellaceae bacterium]MBP9730543.1 DUF3570 domain-containing protein [Moraxellaceae bacterium]